MLKRTPFIMIVIAIIIFQSCDPVDNRLTIVNNTNQPLFFIRSPADSLEGRSCYKEFFDIVGGDTVWIESDNFIKPRSEKKVVVLSDWERLIKDRYNGRLRIYFLDAYTLKKYGWEEIKRNNKYFLKYSLTISDLKKMKWRVVVE